MRAIHVSIKSQLNDTFQKQISVEIDNLKKNFLISLMKKNF